MTPVLDAVRREELTEEKLEAALRGLDYLIDDVVADAYVRGAEGLSTEVSPQSAKTLHDAIAAAISDTTLALLAYIAEREAGRVEDHKWFDPRCHFDGCRSLILEAALKRLSFAAQTTGGTAGRDDELVAAIEQAEAALLPKASVRKERDTRDINRKPAPEGK